VAKGLNNLWHEEEGQVHRVLFEDTMSILQHQGIIVISPLKECDCNNRWNGCPQQEVLDMRSARKR
jgi:hypothetical protein